MVAERGGDWQSVAECSFAAVKAGLWSANELNDTSLAKIAKVTPQAPVSVSAHTSA
jgi:hypothetical protein